MPAEETTNVEKRNGKNSILPDIHPVMSLVGYGLSWKF